MATTLIIILASLTVAAVAVGIYVGIKLVQVMDAIIEFKEKEKENN